MSSGRLGFTKLLVTDLEASAAFYETVFGLKENHRVHSQIGDRKIDEILFHADANGATFVLLKFDGTTEPSRDEVILGFITPDIGAVFQRVREAGGAVAQPPRIETQHGVHVGFITDNEGHLIEVVQLLA